MNGSRIPNVTPICRTFSSDWQTRPDASWCALQRHDRKWPESDMCYMGKWCRTWATMLTKNKCVASAEIARLSYHCLLFTKKTKISGEQFVWNEQSLIRTNLLSSLRLWTSHELTLATSTTTPSLLPLFTQANNQMAKKNLKKANPRIQCLFYLQ